MIEILTEFISQHLELTIFGAITLVQVAPIKINPWGAILNSVKAVLIKDLEEKVNTLTDDVKALNERVDEREAVSARSRIQRFGDEVFHGTKHSKEHFEGVLLDIDFYENYCKEHPLFKNNVTVATTKRIKDIYLHLCETHGFL